MSTENKTIDMGVEANVPFNWLLQFEDVDDVTGESTRINLTGSTFKGVIKGSLAPGAPVIETFTITLINATLGVVGVSLSKTQTANIATKATTLRDKYNPRLRFVGYYDIIMTKTSTNSNYRVLEGKVFISDGVTT